MTISYRSARYVARHLGVSLTSVHNWRSSDTSGFPKPAGCIVSDSGQRAAFGWTDEQIDTMRAWYADRYSLTLDAARTRWQIIDASIESPEPKKPDNFCTGQMLFSIPLQRTGEAA